MSPTYPTEFPTAAVTDLIGFLRTHQGDKAKLLDDAYQLEGWALGLFRRQQAAAEPPALKAAPGPRHADHEDYARALEGLTAQHEQHRRAGGPAGFNLPPWLLPLVIQIVQDILQHKPPAAAPAP